MTGGRVPPAGCATIDWVRCPVVVGRVRELERLMRAANAAWAGRGSWFTITGEAGIGKTRLAAEAARRFSERGGRVVIGRCSPLDVRTPFRPLAEAMLTCAGNVERPGPVAGLDPYLPAVARVLPPLRPDHRHCGS